MSRPYFIISALGAAGVFVIGVYLLFTNTSITCKELPPMNLFIQTKDDVISLFPKSPEEITSRAECSIARAQKAIDEVVALEAGHRNFANTAFATDRISAFSDISVAANTIEVLEYVHPDEAIRNAAHNAIINMRNFYVDALANNQALYKAFKDYAQGSALHETLRQDQQYYVQEMMADFKRAGLDLPAEQLDMVKALNKELTALGMEFEQNISTNNRTIAVTREELAGLEDDFINALKRAEDGKYLLGVDYPTYFNVMENCAVADTRKKLFLQFSNRGYPANDVVLKKIIAKRDELAHLLGFASYAHLDIAAEMAKTPERVTSFLQGLIAKANVKADREYALFKNALPESVVLTSEGKFNPWDTSYVKNQFKKQYLQVDENKVAEYFPMENTIKELLEIYEEFLSVRFEQLPVAGLWHDEVQLVAAYNKSDNQLIGYLLLDLYPRDNKYSHACHITVVPSIKGEDNTIYPAVSLVIANFPKSTATKPSLLKFNDVNTFFHEFGHAMHALLGRTYLASQAGTNVKRDFVEMPSQMLEEWLQNKDILKKIGKHYVTGNPFPDELIANILKVKNFDSGDWTQRQATLSFLSLAMFAPGADKDPYLVQKELVARLRPHAQFCEDDHMYAAFGHLTGYAARYYGYLWSKVFALDMFSYINQEGLLNPSAGQRYIKRVIGKGASEDPNQLIKEFLGREPNEQAFLKDLGI